MALCEDLLYLGLWFIKYGNVLKDDILLKKDTDEESFFSMFLNFELGT